MPKSKISIFRLSFKSPGNEAPLVKSADQMEYNESMLTWHPIKNIDIDEHPKQALNKVNSMQAFTGLIPLAIVFMILFSSEIMYGDTIFLIFLIGLVFFLYYDWLKNRKKYIAMREKSQGRRSIFTQDYSWKDSFQMLGILLVGCVILFMLLFFLIPFVPV